LTTVCDDGDNDDNDIMAVDGR